MSNTSEPQIFPNETEQQVYSFEFRGTGMEYFKIWIVNVLLTIVTVYIYSAWAKVRTNRYFYGNTVLDNSSFEYHVKPLQILLSRIIAAVILVAIVFGQNVHPGVALAAWGVIVVFYPWVMWRSLRFNSQMSSYRNIRFGFDGKLSTLYFIALGLPLIIIAVLANLTYLSTFGAKPLFTGVLGVSVFIFYGLWPWFAKLMSSYQLNNLRYGTTPFSAALKTLSFYAVFGKTLVLFLLPALIVGVLTVIANFMGVDAAGGVRDFFQSLDWNVSSADSEEVKDSVVIAFMLPVYIWFFVLNAYFRARLRGYTYSKTFIGKGFDLQSTVGARSLLWLHMTNLLLIVITMGLAYPWAKVRSARYYAKHTKVVATESLDQFTADQQAKVGAFGEEIGDAFDMDIGL